MSPRALLAVYLERMGPVFDRDAPTLLDHDLMGRDRRRRLGGPRLTRHFGLGEHGN